MQLVYIIQFRDVLISQMYYFSLFGTLIKQIVLVVHWLRQSLLAIDVIHYI